MELSVWRKRLEGLEDELKVLDLPDEGEREARKLMEDEPEDGKDGEDEEMEGQDEEEEDEEESSDGEGTPKKRKPLVKNKKLDSLKKAEGKKKQPRRSELDLAASSQAQILATVDSDTLSRLRLTKKYYLDAIGFIEAIEASMDTVVELLASSVKSEVLEAMEFCKTAKEYKIEAAEVRSLSLSLLR